MRTLLLLACLLAPLAVTSRALTADEEPPRSTSPEVASPAPPGAANAATPGTGCGGPGCCGGSGGCCAGVPADAAAARKQAGCGCKAGAATSQPAP